MYVHKLYHVVHAAIMRYKYQEVFSGTVLIVVLVR